MSGIEALLRAIRGRLRLAWAVDRAARAIAMTAGGVLVVFVVGRWVPLSPVVVFGAWGALGAAVAGVAVRAATMRVPLLIAARAADRGLGGRDQVATAWEIAGRGPTGPIEPVQVERAAAFVTGRRASDAVRVRVPDRPAAAAVAAIAIAAILAALPSPADGIAAARAVEAAAIEEQRDLAARLAEAAEELATTEHDEDLVKTLEDLTAQLEEAKTLEEADQAIDEAESDLLSQLDPDALAERAAVVGLERSLSQDPLPGGVPDDSASEQLEALAQAAEGLSERKRADAADRLAGVARTAEATNPALGAALRDAARALRSGGSASEALSRAAGAQRSAVSSAAASDRLTAALSRVGQLREGLAGAAGGGAQDDGQGRAGEGEGEGNGAGEGSGQGGTPGLGDATGQGAAGAGFGEGGGLGEGGAGSIERTRDGGLAQVPSDFGSTGSSSYGLNPGDQVARGGVYDPGSLSSSGIEEQITGQLGEGGEEDLLPGARGVGERGEVLVPFHEVLPHYRRAFVRAVQTEAIPISLRTLVRDYFAALIEAAG